MNIYIITWIIIVGALALTFVFRAIENFRKECGNKEGDPHFFEISKDTELFYCQCNSKRFRKKFIFVSL